MTTLDDKLEDFAQGRIVFDTLNESVEEMSSSDFSATTKFMSTLSTARDSGLLDQEQYHGLLTQVISADKIDVTPPIVANDMMATQSFSATQNTDQAVVVGAGSIIKDRFILERLLGAGGIGVVYQARDRIKVEAKDRDPSVAIKVLNEDFKVHPESFISLQRECSKAQKLAHPNIATVYDFDRTGGMAFMTMEMLRGQPLNEFFANDLPDIGLPFDQAWPIIQGLASALAYAHKNHIVHSDFKPANAFLCENGEVKVLDFGIARAIKNPGQTEITVFDAGSLGALTPSYASPEMLDGEPPDPRDDVYALGVVSYILLASAHPYDRNAANLAKALELKPEPIPTLSRVQNTALAHSLLFDRNERTPDVETFLRELGDSAVEKKLKAQSRLLSVLATGFVILIVCVVYLLLR